MVKQQLFENIEEAVICDFCAIGDTDHCEGCCFGDTGFYGSEKAID